MRLVTKTRPSRATTERELAELRVKIERVKERLVHLKKTCEAVGQDPSMTAMRAQSVAFGIGIAVDLIERELKL